MKHHRLILRGLTFVVFVAALYSALRAGAGPSKWYGLSIDDHPTVVASRALVSQVGPASDSPGTKRLGPRAQFASREFDFGAVEPFRTHRHSFAIRNMGDTPLTLFSRGTTCSCLELDIDPHTVMPGTSGNVTVTWDAQALDDELYQRAAVATNDPAQPTIEFELRGKTRLVLAAEPPTLTAPRIKATETTQVETVIVSPEWNNFTLDVRPSLADATWTLHALQPLELQSLKVKSGWRLVVTLPAGLPPGALRERVYLTARPVLEGSAAQGEAGAETDAVAAEVVDEVVEREIPLVGNVVGRLTVYGKDVNAWGSIEAGTIDARTGYDGLLTVKVNDQRPELSVTRITADPPIINARLEAYSEAGAPGLYRLHVQIPPSKTPAAHLGDRRGKLTIYFDHPRIEKLELGVEFVVMKSR